MGSKEETFFDSRAWLDSDCEDDFYSVNGDFTPSRGSTPLHPSRGNTPLHEGISVPQVNKALLEEKTPKSKPETSPTEKKKKLAELFQDSFGNEEDIPNILNNQHKPNGKTGLKATPVFLPSKSPHSTPHMSGGNSMTSSERTANGSGKLEKEKHSKSMQCCLPVPSLISSSSFNDRKRTSPVIARG
ncbi:hypothetical protein RJ641_007099 [Dillenia turbinata]|uniref:Uncharacterized protein n=1 Tax=Dillenia turbinata TaxID=194707 RepID=A0AAN8V500_9MAGN